MNEALKESFFQSFLLDETLMNGGKNNNGII